MADFDASSPQLKLTKRLSKAYLSLDLSDLEPILSKNYQYESFPECADLPKQTKESHLQVWRGILSSLNKLEVRIQHRRIAFKLRLTSIIPR
jgi:hypothetical protein